MTHRPETDGPRRLSTHTARWPGTPHRPATGLPAPGTPQRPDTAPPWPGAPQRPTATGPWPAAPPGGTAAGPLQANRFSVRRRWTVPPSTAAPRPWNVPVAPAAEVARPPAGTMPLDVMPFELQVGDWLPFTDEVARRVVDLRAVGPGNAYRRVDVGDVPALTVTHRVRVYRDVARVVRPGRGGGGAAAR
ncbi:hypothetical protein [Streptomyces sp. enrichment culture]|uniref:hypothetical protein n=1 Tax=Streptomyces sp. enrichment culture TaxID=1795815 RepID=UPI003F575B56